MAYGKTGYVVLADGIKEIGINVVMNNILDKKYESNGYTYGYIYGAQEIREVFYYPQAGRNFLAGFEFEVLGLCHCE